MIQVENYQVIGLTARAKKVAVLLSLTTERGAPDSRTINVDIHDAPSLFSMVKVTYEWDGPV